MTCSFILIRSPLSNVTVEVSVWDLEGTCPYNKINKNISVPSKITLPVFEMQYQKSHNAKPVYFLLLMLLDTSAKPLSRNFYWLNLPSHSLPNVENHDNQHEPISIKNNCEYGNMNVEEPATETTEGLLSGVSSLFSGRKKTLK